MFYFFLFLLICISFFTYSGGVFWSYFFIIILFFCLIILIYEVNRVIIYNYIVFQEILGYLYIISFSSWFPLFIIFVNLGIAPFHWWLFIISDSLSGFPLNWLLIYHNFFFSSIAVSLFTEEIVTLLWFGLLLLQLQIFSVSNYNILFVILTQESIGWIFLLIGFSLVIFWYTLSVYLLILIISTNIFSESSFMELSFILVIMSTPLLSSFFVNYICLSYLFTSMGIFFFFPIIFIVFSIISSCHFLFISFFVVEISLFNFSFFSFLVFPSTIFFLL